MSSANGIRTNNQPAIPNTTRAKVDPSPSSKNIFCQTTWRTRISDNDKKKLPTSTQGKLNHIYIFEGRKVFNPTCTKAKLKYSSGHVKVIRQTEVEGGTY